MGVSWGWRVGRRRNGTGGSGGRRGALSLVLEVGYLDLSVGGSGGMREGSSLAGPEVGGVVWPNQQQSPSAVGLADWVLGGGSCGVPGVTGAVMLGPGWWAVLRGGCAQALGVSRGWG